MAFSALGRLAIKVTQNEVSPNSLAKVSLMEENLSLEDLKRIVRENVAAVHTHPRHSHPNEFCTGLQKVPFLSLTVFFNSCYHPPLWGACSRRPLCSWAMSYPFLKPRDADLSLRKIPIFLEAWCDSRLFWISTPLCIIHLWVLRRLSKTSAASPTLDFDGNWGVPQHPVLNNI